MQDSDAAFDSAVLEASATAALALKVSVVNQIAQRVKV
jgi:hypothetical protein